MTDLLEGYEATIRMPRNDIHFQDYRAVVTANRSVWAEALKSGDWEQGRAYLARQPYPEERAGHDGYSYCCLGVACEISGDLFDVEVRGHGALYKSYNNASATPSSELLWLMGMSREVVDMLMTLNDSKKFNFEQIAAVVESMPIDMPDEAGRPQQWNN